jgi:hypothetical protein
MPARCDDLTEPYPVQAGELRLVVVDTSSAADERPSAASVQGFAAQFAAVRTMVSERSWLVMHKPLWALLPPGRGTASAGQTAADLNPTLQAATGNALPTGIDRVLSGHIHLFEMLSFADGRPPQFVLGTGGTELDRPLVGPLAGQALADTTVASGFAVARFGFTTLERSGSEWTVALRDPGGSAQVLCAGPGARVRCTP